MGLHLGGVEPELGEADIVVMDAVFPAVAIWWTEGAIEAADPSQEWQTQRSSAALARLLVDIAFFIAEPAELPVEPWPGGAPASEQTQALHGNVEGRCVRVLSPGVGFPHPIHPFLPAGLEVGREVSQIIIQERSLEKIAAVGIRTAGLRPVSSP